MVSQRSIDAFVDFGSLDGYEHLALPSLEPAGAAAPGDEELYRLPPGVLETLSRRAFSELSFRLPVEQVEGIAAILSDPQATEADLFVAAQLLRNATIAAEGILPLCQDTGTAVAYCWKGSGILSDGRDEEELARGASAAYAEHRLRASQLAPLGFISEANTRDNLPALVDLRAAAGGEYRLCFAAKGGGSANRTSLSMESPTLLGEAPLESRLSERIRALGASACPPYRILAVVGGSSPDQALRALALSGLGLLDTLPETGCDGSPLRDRGWEARMMRMAEASGVGAQFGGTRMALDARALRLPRHAASLPLAVGVSCVAHRRAKAIISRDGVFLERLEADPGRLLPRELPLLSGARRVDLDRPQRELAAELGSLSPGSFLLLSGSVLTARDAAHARFRALLAAGKPLPEYLARHPIFYAGPTEAAPGAISGSFGPTTAGRMDDYLGELMAKGASLVSIAKGGRSAKAREAIARAGGVYLACLGGAAALAAREHIVASEIVDYADLGMEAVRRVVLRDLPAMIVVNASGADFYEAAKR
jgi:fumarate hydratase class I